MDFQQLRLFIAVAEELHFGRAAEKLHMAQPPVTRGIQQLERELGTKLFDRSTRSVRLTAAGQALVQPARDVLSAVQRARRVALAAGRGEVGRVTLTYAGASTHVLVGVLAREVRRHHPGIELGLYSQSFALPALGRVLRMEMDLGLGRWDVIPADIRTRVVADEHLVIAVPASHRLADADGVHMVELAGEPFVALPPHEGAVLGDRLRRLSHGAGFEAEIVQIAPDSWTAMALVGAAVGCSLTLSSVAENVTDSHVRFVRVLDDTLPVQLRLAWRADNHNPALTAVLALTEKVWPAEPA
ncbi:LysR substrate-binding domain-containing protein [Kocuria rosea]|uniref:LysR family transcriptional regulator n=1 Tax=Kocuria rosea TaxID=1275 RepID=A0A4R5YFP9_KOCRO|nr:LysR substrate-binding domain-containing protein [Kocuria rosea]TDL43107.1 LysR family transcriptional regulator [Kocuria rosea]